MMAVSSTPQAGAALQRSSAARGAHGLAVEQRSTAPPWSTGALLPRPTTCAGGPGQLSSGGAVLRRHPLDCRVFLRPSTPPAGKSQGQGCEE